MWIFAVEGFVSVVAVRGSKDRLLVRGRVREDLAHWSRLAGDGGVRKTPRADYLWRFVTTRKRFAKALAKMLAAVQYENFKGAVGHDDPGRARAYMDVWGSMVRLQQEKAHASEPSPLTPRLAGIGPPRSG